MCWHRGVIVCDQDAAFARGDREHGDVVEAFKTSRGCRSEVDGRRSTQESRHDDLIEVGVGLEPYRLQPAAGMRLLASASLR
jgi:hypothetical protein